MKCPSLSLFCKCCNRKKKVTTSYLPCDVWTPVQRQTPTFSPCDIFQTSPPTVSSEGTKHTDPLKGRKLRSLTKAFHSQGANSAKLGKIYQI